MGAVLQDKVAFITGGSGGIGGSAARFLLRDGASVLLMGRRIDALEAMRGRLIDEIQDAHIALHAGDAGSTEDVEAGLKKAHAMAGRLDIIVPTVGGGGYRPLLMHDAKSFMQTIEVNIATAFLAVRYGVPLMKNGGAVVCVSSTAAVRAFSYLSAYCTGKGGLEMFVRAVADELGPLGIRINAIRPGMTRNESNAKSFANEAFIKSFTEQMPLGRTGVADDIGQGIRFLAGPESGWMTGQSFAIDGGHELRRNPDVSAMVRNMVGDEAMDALLRGQAPTA